MTHEHNLAPLRRRALAEAESPLLRLRTQYLTELSELEKVIVSVRNLDSKPEATETASEVPIAAGQYKGWPKPKAFKDYMQKRQGHKIALDRIAADLLIAGVHEGKRRSPEQTPSDTMTQNLKIALAQQDRVKPLYEYSPPGRLTNVDARDITVWLAETSEKKKK